MQLSEEFLPQIQEKFTPGRVMPVAVCVNNTQPYLEKEFVYPNAAQWNAVSRMLGLGTIQIS